MPSRTPVQSPQASSQEPSFTGNPDRSYLLDLGLGPSWILSGPGLIRPIVEKLADALRLRPGTHDAWPRIVLGSKPTGFSKGSNARSVPTHGWRAMDLGGSRIWSHDDVADVFCEVDWCGNPNGVFLAWTSIVHCIYQRAIQSGGLPLHAALVERGGKGVALLGSSGRGKSTCCLRLPQSWHALSDDHTLVLAGEGPGFDARPFPTWGELLQGEGITLPDIQCKVPLAALFFLEQTGSDEIRPIGTGEAAVKIYESAIQTFWSNLEALEKIQPRVMRARLFENACRLSEAVKSYILGVSLTGQFWEKIDGVIP